MKTKQKNNKGIMNILLLPLLFLFAIAAASSCGGGGGGGGGDNNPGGGGPTSVSLPKTGQTTCYDSVGNVLLSCAGTGQDGELQKGAASSPRFTDNGNGTVTDNLTGLIWLKNANCFGVQTWANGLNAANTLNSGECGLTDGSVEGNWRLPNRKELRSLVHAGYNEKDCSGSGGSNPCATNAEWLNSQGFSYVQAFYYWSSSTCAFFPSYAWFVYMNGGYVYGFNKTNTGYVWPVRAGQ